MAFHVTRSLRFGDCDPSGIAYFPAYLDIMVGVVEEFFSHVGAAWPALLRERRIGLPTVRLNLDFASPGFHGDVMDFTIRPRAIGRSTLDLDTDVAARGRLLWSARQRIVATSLDTHRSCPWPGDLRAALTQQLEISDA